VIPYAGPLRDRYIFVTDSDEYEFILECSKSRTPPMYAVELDVYGSID
jgi:hypothetical protein